MKNILKELKTQKNAEISEIKYVSRTLRNKLSDNKKSDSQDQDDININQDKFTKRSFWGYIKHVLNRKDSVLPSFSMSYCASYFRKNLSLVHPHKFSIPSWIPRLSTPEISFNLDPPTYKKVVNITRKMKASGSPCPLDQLSIICFKRCPILHTNLTNIIHQVWTFDTVPTEWKKACTILTHKKGDTKFPSNFRPIALEFIPIKIFTSCLRNSMFPFFTANKSFEHKIQKGFNPGLSGTLEHTIQMANINKSRIKKRYLVITLLDLKNAFSEVYHNLIQSVLEYNHIPDHIKILVKSFKTLRPQSSLQNSTLHLIQLAVVSFKVIVPALNSLIYASTLLSNT